MSKGSAAMMISCGLVDPKPSLRKLRVGDGQGVNILLPVHVRYHDGVTEFENAGSGRSECK